MLKLKLKSKLIYLGLFFSLLGAEDIQVEASGHAHIFSNGVQTCTHLRLEDIGVKPCVVKDCTTHMSFNSTHYNIYEGRCPGNFEIYDYITWWQRRVNGAAANVDTFMHLGDHQDCYITWEREGGGGDYNININDPGDQSIMGYSITKLLPAMNPWGNFTSGRDKGRVSPTGNREYRVEAELFCEENCQHYGGDKDGYYSPSSHMRSGGHGGWVSRNGYQLTRCNVCHIKGKDADGGGVCAQNQNGKSHLWYGDIGGFTQCWHCGYTLPAVSLGACTESGGVYEVSLGWSTSVDKNDPEQNGAWVENIQVGSNKDPDTETPGQRQVVSYGGDIRLTVTLENINKKLETIVTQCYWTKNGDGTPIAGVGAGGLGGNGYNYALPSTNPEAKDASGNLLPWTHEYSIDLTNVTESDNYYQFHIRTIDGAVITSPRLYVDTTIIFFDYSADDNTENNELYYYKGNLLDESGVVHSRDNVKPDAGNYNTMVQSRALIPIRTYEYDENDKKDGKEALPAPVLYFRYTLNPRTVLPPKAGNPDKTEDYLVSIDTLNNSIVDYSVQMPTYFIENQFDLDDGFRTNTPSAVKGSDLSKAKFYNKYKATGITYPNEDAKSDRYSYDIFNVIRFSRWVLHTNPNKLLIAHPNSGKSVDRLRGTMVKDDITPDNLGVLGLHWAEAVWEKDIAIGSGAVYRPAWSALQLPKPERLFVLKLDTEGGEFVDSPRNEEIITLGTRYNNRVGTATYVDDEDFNYMHQTAKGGTYNGANILKGYKGDYFTYRYNFGGWYSSDTYQPEYHVHEGDPSKEGGCYRSKDTHKHTSACVSNIVHAHSDICYEYSTHSHEGNSQTYGGCFTKVRYHKHEYVYKDSNGEYVREVQDKGYIAPTKGGCYTHPYFHKHDGSVNQFGDCYTHKLANGKWGKTCAYEEGDIIGYVAFTCGSDSSHHVHKDGHGVARPATYESPISGGCFTHELEKLDGSVVYIMPGCTDYIDGYALSCTIDTNIVETKLICGLEGSVEGTEYICGQTEGNVNGWSLSCGMTENTVVGYTKGNVPVSPQKLQETDSEGHISTLENLDLMASWNPIHLDLPQVNKPGYVFLGWYTVPQSHIFPDIPTGGVLGTGAVYGDTFDTNFYEGFYAGAGYNPENYGKPNYEKNTKFLESSVNMNNPQNSVTLYAWYNRKPIYADLYEGLFFEGQDVSLKDLTRLVGVFDYEDDYYNEKLQQIYNLPEVDLEDIYLPVIKDTNEDYEEEEKDNNLDSDISTSNPKDNSYTPQNPTGEDVYFDWSRWEKVTSLGTTTEVHPDGESILDGGSYGSNETDPSGKNPDGSDSNAVVQHTVDAKTSKLDIQDGKIIMPISSSGTRADGSTYSYTKGQKIDGVYRYIGDDAEYRDKIFFTVEAKEALETLIKGTSLDLRVKEIHYHVKDNKKLNTPEIVDFSSISSDKYDDIIRQQEAVAGKYTHNGVVSTDAHVIKEHYRPVYGLDTSTSRLIKEAKTPENLPDVNKWYGEFDIVFQVTDRGILHGNTILEDAMNTKVDESDVTKISGSSVTLEYKRKCRIQYNQRPIIYTSNLTLINDFSSSVVNLKKTLISNQIVIDAEDSQTNIPWWTYKMTMRNLEASLEIVGITDFTVNAGIAKELNMTEEQLVHELSKNISSLEELYEYKNSKDPIKVKKFRAITSFSVIFDAHDQFGKYSSGDVTPYRQHEDIVDGSYPDTPEPEPPAGEDPAPIDPRPIDPNKGRPKDPIPGTKDGDPGSTDPTKDPDGELEKDKSDYEPWNPIPGIPPEVQPKIEVDLEKDEPIIIQREDFRKSTVYLIDVYADASMTNANVHEEIRFISSKYMGLLKKGGSYFGSVGYGLEKLESILNTKNTGDVKNTYSDPYQRMDGKEVDVTVYDYTE